MQLARRAGVLLGPQLKQGFRDPAVDGPEAVQPRVAGGAEGDQGIVGVPRVAMMDHKPFSGPADAAAMVVAGQDFLAQAAEAGAGAAPAPVAGPTPPPVKESETPTGAAEGDLGVGGHKRTPIAYYKKHYHRVFYTRKTTLSGAPTVQGGARFPNRMAELGRPKSCAVVSA